MEILDDSENNAKISDSAYSNSCGNSQSRRSNSSKSTHSGSNSSGSSGYGGQPSTSGSSNQLPEKRIKEEDPKKEKQIQVESIEKTMVTTECRPPDPLPVLETPNEEHNVDHTSSPGQSHIEKGPESMDISSLKSSESKDKVGPSNFTMGNPSDNFASSQLPANCSDGFSCVVSMLDGVVVYTTSSLTTILGFPKDMWIGRSFIDFVHPKDQNTLTSHITNGLPLPKMNSTTEKVLTPGNSVSNMVCRIRRYRGLVSGYGIKDQVMAYVPCQLKLTLKNVSDTDGEHVYLVTQATPFFSAFKVPNEIPDNLPPFVLRHAANGNVEYIDTESVSYLGYLPQELIGESVLKLYHADDLLYLSQVYEEIVKEGAVPKSKPIRLLTQNGEYIKVETEWSSFINPWSRKVEFVTAKHQILEGPRNPDVFQIIEPEKPHKLTKEEKKQESLRDSIIKVMNEALTKPAEVARQQMSKRCQELASFVESITEEQPKVDELRVEIQDAHSCYGRDSMFGSISPHHDHNDSKSSTDTHLSYNQLNFNENLQRYFTSHQPLSNEDHVAVTGEHILGLKDAKKYDTACLSPTPLPSGDSAGLISSCESDLSEYESSLIGSMPGYQRVRLTETLLSKHNTKMEKELVRVHRDIRTNSKGDREKASNENRQKKIEHMARCNATFFPVESATNSILDADPKKQPHGVKRTSNQDDQTDVTYKHHCTTPHQSQQQHITTATVTQPSATITTTAAGTVWHQNPVNNINNMNTYILGVGYPQQMPIMSPVIPQQVAAMPGHMYPMYAPMYTPAQATPMPGTSTMNNTNHTNNSQFQTPAMQCTMMYGAPIYGSPMMYPHVAPQGGFTMQQAMMAPTSQYINTLNPLGLSTSNYNKACKLSEPQLLTKTAGGWRDLKRGDRAAVFKRNYSNVDNNLSANTLSRSSEPVPGPLPQRNVETKAQNSNEAIERTDGESSYSSFYSSFFNTDSSGTEDGFPKKGQTTRESSSTANVWYKNSPDDQSSMEASTEYRKPKPHNNITRRKMEPPWMEHVFVTPELNYKYQILTRSVDEVLEADKLKLATMKQPSLVNEQLGQLYTELQLEGEAARLTLEEGITSSSSSGEETGPDASKPHRKLKYSKLSMIYEADAPLPPPLFDEE